MNYGNRRFLYYPFLIENISASLSLLNKADHSIYFGLASMEVRGSETTVPNIKICNCNLRMGCMCCVCREACDHVLGVEAGAFYDTIIPETVSALWGPIPLGRLTPRYQRANT
jgi:hypothetical protein